MKVVRRTILAVLIVIASLVVSSCAVFGWLFPKEASIGAVFVEGGTSRHARAIPGQNARIDGMYFGEIEIVAYQYSPGFTDTGGFGYNGVGDGTGEQRDWAYFVVLQSGHEAARDIVLESGEIVDIGAFNADYSYELNSDFTDAYDSFSVDFFEVNVYRSGVIVDNIYYGMNADYNGLEKHPLHDYPELAGIPDYYRDTNIEGFPSQEQSFSIFFARDDWFPDPVLVQLAEDWDAHAFTYDWSSSPLNDDQIAKLESLATNGTGRRFYGNLVVVPYGGPALLSVNQNAPGMERPSAVVSFEYDTLLSDATWNDYVADNFLDGDVVYLLKNSVPFGLTVEFMDEGSE